MEDHFLVAEVLARFNLSINTRSEAEHLERTTPISDSFLRSIATSAAPSRSLVTREKELLEGTGLTTSGDMAVQHLTLWQGGLGPSAQALLWKHTSWLHTCCCSSYKLQQKPEEELWGSIGNGVLTTLTSASLNIYLKFKKKGMKRCFFTR